MDWEEEMDWKEQLALQFRELRIDTNIISKAMQNFVDIFNGSLDKYNVKDVQATTDSKNYIDIQGYKKIKIGYYIDEIFKNLIQANIKVARI